MKSRCHWRGCFSDYFDVSTGTKQGGVLSPRIFTMYVDDLVIKLRNRGVGCHVLGLFLACIFYADDLCLLAPSRGAMQEMLNICHEYCSEFCLTFNVKKTKVVVFGPLSRGHDIQPLRLNGKPIDFVNEWKYLDVTIVSGTSMQFSSKPVLASFYRAVNCVLSSVRKPNELVLMNLLYTNCVPVLAYAAEIVEFSATEMRECNVALNNAIRRIYSYNRWESTRALHLHLGYQNIYEIFSTRRERFIHNCLESSNHAVMQMTIIHLSTLLEL